MSVLPVGLIVGGYLFANSSLSRSTAYVRWVFIGFSVLGVLYVVVGFRRVYQQEGLYAAVNWLFGNRSAGNTHSLYST